MIMGMQWRSDVAANGCGCTHEKIKYQYQDQILTIVAVQISKPTRQAHLPTTTILPLEFALALLL